jgi:homoserine O-acetyltransferase
LKPTPPGKTHHTHAGQKGLKAARAIGLLSYRNYQIMVEKQTDNDTEKLDHYKASSYIIHQGDKLVSRFNAYTYWLLTKAMDSHQIARGRGKSAAQLLSTISQPTLIIAVTSDILCPPEEQRFLARHLPNATLCEMDSSYGHDGFLIEAEKISQQYRHWIKKQLPKLFQKPMLGNKSKFKSKKAYFLRSSIQKELLKSGAFNFKLFQNAIIRLLSKDG